jgi:Uma2 family endonuclease
VHEYLDAGVSVVILINPDREAIGVYRRGMREEEFGIDQHLTLPDLLPGFSLAVKELFQ